MNEGTEVSAVRCILSIPGPDGSTLQSELSPFGQSSATKRNQAEGLKLEMILHNQKYEIRESSSKNSSNLPQCDIVTQNILHHRNAFRAELIV